MQKGRSIGRIIWVVSLLALAVIVLYFVAQDAQASWSGTPLPPYGNDWYIDEDTEYTSEVIKLYGTIYVWWPYTLTLTDCNVTIRCDWDGYNGIYVDWDANLYLTKTSVQNLPGYGSWYFYCYGNGYLDGAKLYSLSDADMELTLTMSSSEVYGCMWGWYNYASPTTIKDSKFYEMNTLYLAGSTTDMTNVQIFNRRANFYSYIYTAGSTATMTGCTISNGPTTAYTYFYNYATLTMKDCTFSGVNYFYSSTKLTATGCTFGLRSGSFNVNGQAYLFKDTFTGTTQVQLSGKDNWVDSCSIKGVQYGLAVYGPAHVGNTTIDVLYKPTNTNYPGTARGLDLYNKAINLYNIAISVDYQYNYTYNTSSWSTYTYAYGLYVSGANIGQLTTTNITSIKVTQNIAMHDHYMSSYIYFYQYMYTYAIYMTGDTVCTVLRDIPITVKENLYMAPYNATYRSYMYSYNYQNYIYSAIGQKGKALIEVTNLKLSGIGPTLRTGGRNVYTPYSYRSSQYLFYFSDHKDSRAGDATFNFHHNTFSQLNVGYLMYLNIAPMISIHDNTFKDSKCHYLMYINQPQKLLNIELNQMTDLTSASSYGFNARGMVYLYNPKGEMDFLNNTVERCSPWAFFYMTQSADRAFIQGNTFRDNGQITTGSDAWMFIESNTDKVTMSDNTFERNSATYFLRFGSNTKRSVVEKNTFTGNSAKNWLVAVMSNNEEVSFTDNVFKENRGPVFWFQSTNRRVNFERNTVTGNIAGAAYLMYTYYTYNELRVTDNDFNNNSADGALLYFNGPTASYWPGTVAFTVERNSFSDNVASSAVNGGVVVIKGAMYETPVRRNTFTHNTGNCINFYRPYTYYSNYYTNTLTADGNDFMDNDGTCTLWVDFNGYNIIAKRNSGSGNSGPLMKVYNTARSVYDYSYPSCVGNLDGPLSINAENNNYSYNKGGALDIRGQWHDVYNTYSMANQQISVRNNILTFNGDDYVVRIVDFGAAPQLHNNEFTGSQYGVFLQAIDYVALWPRLQLSYTNETYDGGIAGVTAWALINVDADFYNCTFRNYRWTLYEKDGTTNVWWSAIPEASGVTEGRGYIYVNNHLELHVTWANALGEDSGAPAVGASVAMMGENGRYYGEMLTDKNGRIGPMIVQPWTSIEGKTDAWSPYRTTVLSGGLTGSYVVHAIGELMGATAVHLIMVDSMAPQIVVTMPSSGSVSNLLDMPAEGFLFESGSGVKTFEGWVDSMAHKAITPETLWSAMFLGQAPGQHTMFFRVEDLSGNTGTASVPFMLDAQAPSLDITSPKEGLITAQRTITIQGAYADDLSDLSEISVRINGERLQDVSGGHILKSYDLTEGVNTIIVDATDAAGNRATVTLTVTLDTYPPTLYVNAPLDNLLTSEPVLLVTGVSDAGTAVLVELVPSQSGAVRRNVTVVAGPDGSFTAELDLYEGSQLITVTATDSPAGNTRTISRHVTLDTTPPGLVIDTPKGGEYFKTAEITLVGHILDVPPGDIKVFINGRPIEQNGMFTAQIALVEGANAITVTAEDAVGNVAVKTISVTRDTVKPVLVVDVPAFLLTNEKTLVVRGTVNIAVDRLQSLKVGGQDASYDEEGKFSVPVDLSAETGPLLVEATDMAGNTALYEIVFVYDGAKPVLNVNNPPAQTSKTYTFVNGTVSDDKAVITTVKIMGQNFPVIDGRFTALVDLKTSGDGWNNFTVEAQDDAGNLVFRRQSVQYVPPPAATVKEVGGLTNEALIWIGLIFLAAGLTLVVTAWYLSKREVRA
jgi:hypothetical protein